MPSNKKKKAQARVQAGAGSAGVDAGERDPDEAEHAQQAAPPELATAALPIEEVPLRGLLFSATRLLACTGAPPDVVMVSVLSWTWGLGCAVVCSGNRRAVEPIRMPPRLASAVASNSSLAASKSSVQVQSSFPRPVFFLLICSGFGVAAAASAVLARYRRPRSWRRILAWLGDRTGLPLLELEQSLACIMEHHDRGPRKPVLEPVQIAAPPAVFAAPPVVPDANLVEAFSTEAKQAVPALPANVVSEKAAGVEESQPAPSEADAENKTAFSSPATPEVQSVKVDYHASPQKQRLQRKIASRQRAAAQNQQVPRDETEFAEEPALDTAGDEAAVEALVRELVDKPTPSQSKKRKGAKPADAKAVAVDTETKPTTPSKQISAQVIPTTTTPEPEALPSTTSEMPEPKEPVEAAPPQAVASRSPKAPKQKSKKKEPSLPEPQLITPEDVLFSDQEKEEGSWCVAGARDKRRGGKRQKSMEEEAPVPSVQPSATQTQEDSGASSATKLKEVEAQEEPSVVVTLKQKQTEDFTLQAQAKRKEFMEEEPPDQDWLPPTPTTPFATAEKQTKEKPKKFVEKSPERHAEKLVKKDKVPTSHHNLGPSPQITAPLPPKNKAPGPVKSPAPSECGQRGTKPPLLSDVKSLPTPPAPPGPRAQRTPAPPPPQKAKANSNSRPWGHLPVPPPSPSASKTSGGTPRWADVGAGAPLGILDDDDTSATPAQLREAMLEELQHMRSDELLRWFNANGALGWLQARLAGGQGTALAPRSVLLEHAAALLENGCNPEQDALDRASRDLKELVNIGGKHDDSKDTAPVPLPGSKGSWKRDSTMGGPADAAAGPSSSSVPWSLEDSSSPNSSSANAWPHPIRFGVYNNEMGGKGMKGMSAGKGMEGFHKGFTNVKGQSMSPPDSMMSGQMPQSPNDQMYQQQQNFVTFVPYNGPSSLYPQQEWGNSGAGGSQMMSQDGCAGNLPPASAAQEAGPDAGGGDQMATNYNSQGPGQMFMVMVPANQVMMQPMQYGYQCAPGAWGPGDGNGYTNFRQEGVNMAQYG